MASAIVRSSLRAALRGGARPNPASKRSFSSGASADEEAREAAKWEKITYVGIAACSILAFVNLSKGHPHFEEPPGVNDPSRVAGYLSSACKTNIRLELESSSINFFKVRLELELVYELEREIN